jgi:hypothetical protein
MHKHEKPLSIGDAAAVRNISITAASAKSFEAKGASATIHAVDSSESLDLHGNDETRYGTARLLLLWKYELLSMVISVGALLAIVAVLFAFDGKPMTRWKAIAQPNTVVSALSTLAKSSMLMVVGQALGQLKWQHFESRPRRLIEFEIFENASRGPWGALDFLYRIHWRALAGSTGAIITVLAVAMDPFAQQVIQFDSRPVTSRNETSVISAARSYDMNSRWESIAGVEFRESYSKSLRHQSINRRSSTLTGYRQGQRYQHHRRGVPRYLWTSHFHAIRLSIGRLHMGAIRKRRHLQHLCGCEHRHQCYPHL